MADLTIKRAWTLHRRVPIDHPVKTAFGVMQERHAVFIVLEDATGAQGVGESWVNFPMSAPWERVAAFEHAYIPYLQGRHIEDVATFMFRTSAPSLLAAISKEACVRVEGS